MGATDLAASYYILFYFASIVGEIGYDEYLLIALIWVLATKIISVFISGP
jgi:hypothetical protein